MELENIHISLDTVFGELSADITFSSSSDELENFKDQCLSEEN
ncbi:hypothetical protein ACFVSW_20265 [Neobacillus sp. NPDC058068]